MTNFEYARIHLFMLLPNISQSKNVDLNAEPYSNQNWTILPLLDSDQQGEHGARWRSKNGNFTPSANSGST